MGTVHLSENANIELVDYIRALGHEIAPLLRDDRRGRGVGDHADLVMCKMGASDLSPVIKADDGEVWGEYPQNAAFCAVVLGGKLIHRLDITLHKILKYAQNAGLELINVRQGYTRCSCVVVDDGALITSDSGIAAALSRRRDIEVLKIQQEHVALDGFEYGFLGGTSGRVGREVIFNGDLSDHPDGEIIRDFIESRGLAVRTFPW
ncbi:MAG: hypothetical protein IKI49_02635, partial [Oscillospiraceae bacterium]|nr:hypothetical protein [Oscillospiraceae bacterium]